MSTASSRKHITPQGEWKVKVFRRWPFDRLRIRWYFEADMPTTAGEEITLDFPPIVYHSGDAIWLCNTDGTFPTRLKGNQ